MKNHKFSLILCTLGRTDLVGNFITSISSQTYQNLELIIVDQNEDERIHQLLKGMEPDFPVLHLSCEKGLSKSRNEGLKYASGEIVAFPDDDCLYPEDLLRRINDFFDGNKFDVLAIKMKNSVPTGRKVQENTKSQFVHKYNVIGLMASISSFYKKEVIDQVGGFDERLGLGANTIFQGCEDYDYPIRALKEGFIIYYTNTIEVLHPWDYEMVDKNKDLKGRSYNGGAAEMFLLNKHNYSLFYRLKRIFRRIMVSLYYMLKRNRYKAGLSIAILRGMIAHFRYRPG
ncbi:glycosyltransferase family 2 protein [Salimicrobium jeotgali]|uniref:glycosyltransferase family 2 protein n=1 Tax=Salimicrobium jeotgali TaxID=1230341 RepID=UPI0015E131C4|nr:glycosyltransferase family A protein [Salimicrobium jeotgali]